MRDDGNTPLLYKLAVSRDSGLVGTLKDMKDASALEELAKDKVSMWVCVWVSDWVRVRTCG
jgi:hypothetical protein